MLSSIIRKWGGSSYANGPASHCEEPQASSSGIAPGLGCGGASRESRNQCAAPKTAAQERKGDQRKQAVEEVRAGVCL